MKKIYELKYVDWLEFSPEAKEELREHLTDTENICNGIHIDWDVGEGYNDIIDKELIDNYGLKEGENIHILYWW